MNPPVTLIESAAMEAKSSAPLTLKTLFGLYWECLLLLQEGEFSQMVKVGDFSPQVAQLDQEPEFSTSQQYRQLQGIILETGSAGCECCLKC